MITQVSPEKRPFKTVLADKPDYLLCGAFVALWLVPISWVGVANQSLPQAGKFLGNQYQIAALFTNRVPHWIEFYIEVQIGNEWVSSPQSHYSSIKMYIPCDCIYFTNIGFNLGTSDILYTIFFNCIK